MARLKIKIVKITSLRSVRKVGSKIAQIAYLAALGGGFLKISRAKRQVSCRKVLSQGGKCMFLMVSNNFVSNKVVTNKFITYLCNRKPISCAYGNGESVRLWQGC